MIILTEEEQLQYERWLSLTDADIAKVFRMKGDGSTKDEIARRLGITPPDVQRILHPIPGYGQWTAEEKIRHWIAGKKRAQTVKKNREANKKPPKFCYQLNRMI